MTTPWASRAASSIGERTLRVLVTPTPLTFADRRSVLQLIEQHGPVEFFKITPGYKSNFVSMTKTPETAKRLAASSPLYYRVPAPRRAADVSGEAEAASASASRPDADRAFTIHIWPIPDYRHRFSMSLASLSRPWSPMYELDRSLMATTLKQSLPRTIAARGLAHWLLDMVELAPHSFKAHRLNLRSWLPSNMIKA